MSNVKNKYKKTFENTLQPSPFSLTLYTSAKGIAQGNQGNTMKTFTFEADYLENYSFHICDIELTSEVETIEVTVEEDVDGLPEILEITFLDEDENEISYKESDLPLKALDALYTALYKAIDDQIELDKEEFEAYQAG